MFRSTGHTHGSMVGIGFAAALMLFASIGGSAAAQPATPTVNVADGGELGQILTGPNGRTLYLYKKDVPGISNCYDQCAVNWPPLIAQGDLVVPDGLDGALGTTVRKDGSQQVTYNGSPVYFWNRDTKPGDTTGQNVGGVWFVLNPAPAPSMNLRDAAELGTIFTDARGMTLYRYMKDEEGVSNCYDQCAVNWPPLLTDADPTGPDAVVAGLGTTIRTDGSQQVTYNGVPLYGWIRDTKPGDTTGQGVGGVWFIVNP